MCLKDLQIKTNLRDGIQLQVVHGSSKYHLLSREISPFMLGCCPRAQKVRLFADSVYAELMVAATQQADHNDPSQRTAIAHRKQPSGGFANNMITTDFSTLQSHRTIDLQGKVIEIHAAEEQPISMPLVPGTQIVPLPFVHRAQQRSDQEEDGYRAYNITLEDSLQKQVRLLMYVHDEKLTLLIE